MTDTRRKPVALALCWCALVAACAHLPDTELLMRDAQPRAVRFDGPGGLLSKEKSAAILARIGGASPPDILEKHVALEEAIAGTRLKVGNKVTLLEDGPATYRAMFAAIRQARDHVNLETYIFDDDETGRQFADLLLQKQNEGVQVNLIYDSVGALKTPQAFFDRLRDGGVRVLEFNPVNPLKADRGWQVNNRDHRKLLVVDGKVAFVGGINISSVYSSRSWLSGSGADFGGNGWRDTHLKLVGPVVTDFQKLFMQTWSKQSEDPPAPRNYFPVVQDAGNQVVRALGASADDQYSAIYVTLMSAITNAEKNVYLTNAYFVPDPQLLEALIEAARRGVDVKLILPSHSDSALVFHAGRSHYEPLLEAGVKIYERQGALLHSKTATVDGVWSTIGSTNLDWRSFLHNDELNAVVLGREFAGQMQSMFERDLKASAAIDRVAWEHRSPITRLKEWAARIWQYWL